MSRVALTVLLSVLVADAAGRGASSGQAMVRSQRGTASAPSHVQVLPDGQPVQADPVGGHLIGSVSPIPAPGGRTATSTEVITARFPVRGKGGLPLKPSLLESTDLLSLATKDTKHETCFQGNPHEPPPREDQDGEEHLHSTGVKTKDGRSVKIALPRGSHDTGHGMLCCEGVLASQDDVDEMQCYRRSHVTSHSIPDRFIQTSLSDMGDASLAEAAEQIARVVREAPEGTLVLVNAAVLDQVRSALGQSDRQKVVEGDEKKWIIPALLILCLFKC